MTRALTQAEFIAKAIRVHGERYDYSKTVYVRSNKKVVVICPEHGEFLTVPNNHTSASNTCGCPRCGGTGWLGLDEFLRRARSLHGERYDYQHVKYSTNGTSVRIVCPEHGEFLQTPAKHLIGRGCQKCGGTARRSRADWLALAAAKHKAKYDYSRVPERITGVDPVPIVCPEHGEFKQSFKLHTLRGYGCARCGQRSAPEDRLADWLESLDIQVIRRSRALISPKELDIYLPERKLAIEVHGVYHHTEDRVRGLHLEKWNRATTAGIRLWQFFDDELREKELLIRNRLLAVLGKSQVYDARKLRVAQVALPVAAEFLDRTHMQGRSRGGVAYGLYADTVLVGVATFGQARVAGSLPGTPGEWEVLRFATDGRIRGGFSRLFAAFLRDHAPREVISYCDLRHGDGAVYRASGFSLERHTPPDYWWVNPRGVVRRHSRYMMQKHRMADPSHPLHAFYSPEKTEAEICQEAGYRRILGVGHQRWLWRACTTPTPVV